MAANFKKISTREIKWENVFYTIDKEWYLVTAKDERGVNTLTANWGSVGCLWHKDVFHIYIRPQRHTMSFLDHAGEFTCSFLPGDYKKAMGYLGRVSGKDEPDKIQTAGLHVTEVEGLPTFDEASLVITCKTLYRAPFLEELFLDKGPVEDNYPTNDFSVEYIAEITGVYVNE